MIETRDAVAADADAIAIAHVEGWRVGYRGVVADEFLDDPAFFTVRRDGWNRRLRDGPPPGGDVLNRIFALLVDGDVVGFGHAGREAEPGPDDPERGEIYGFYVHPDHWGTGAADVLMDVCLTELRTRFGSAVLWTLRDTPRSRRFSERHGWRCGRGDDEITSAWHGPLMPGLPRLTRPLINVRYRIDPDGPPGRLESSTARFDATQKGAPSSTSMR